MYQLLVHSLQIQSGISVTPENYINLIRRKFKEWCRDLKLMGVNLTLKWLAMSSVEEGKLKCDGKIIFGVLSRRNQRREIAYLRPIYVRCRHRGDPPRIILLLLANDAETTAELIFSLAQLYTVFVQQYFAINRS